jgi:two-component system, response regulator
MERRSLPEIVLLDLKLPRISGLEVLKEIRSHEKTRNLPVLVLTSSSEESDIDACLQLGADSFTIKPINSSRYMESVQELVRTWLRPSKGNGRQD